MENRPCRICGELPYPPSADGICEKCRGSNPDSISAREYARKAREREAGPIVDSRQNLPCTRCGNPELIHCRVRERGAKGVAALAVTYVEAPKGEWALGQALGANLTPVGFLNAYICRSCGFVDWYVDHPEELPIGPEYSTELVHFMPGPRTLNLAQPPAELAQAIAAADEEPEGGDPGTDG